MTALFMFSIGWVMGQTGSQGTPLYRLVVVWLMGYAFLVTGPALLTWRVASVVNEGYAIDARRVGLSIVALAVALVTAYYAIWIFLGPSADVPVVIKLILALHGVLFGGASWAALGVAQWTRMSQRGRRDTLVLGPIMALVCLVVTFTARVEPGSLNLNHPAFDTTTNFFALTFVLAFGLIPFLAGLWRLAKT